MSGKTQSKPPEWYRSRGYAHFDSPITVADATRLVTSSDSVARHPFHPLIFFAKSVIRRKSDQFGRRAWKEKVRPLGYVAHVDAHIQSFYATQLSRLMENRYTEGPGNSSVIAYRRLGGKCNIDFALECFRRIEHHGECDVVALDVRGFFDALDHQHLKQRWCDLLGCDFIPDDHYAVFKSVTRDSGITLPTLRDIFGCKVPRRLARTGQRICSSSDFRQLVAPELRPRHEIVANLKREPAGGWQGIPQGTPISATLANLYMYDVDVNIEREASALDGIYRRYSDDIVLIVPAGKGREAEELARLKVRECCLEVQDDKTERCTFRFDGNRLVGFSANAEWQRGFQRNFNYLGFSFDGSEIAIRDSTVSSYIERMRRYVRRARIAASVRNEPVIRKRQLYAKLSDLGWGSAYGDWPDTEGPPKGVPRMGFHKYLRLAADRMNSERVRRQGRQLTNQLYRVIRQEEAALKKSLE